MAKVTKINSLTRLNTIQSQLPAEIKKHYPKEPKGSHRNPKKLKGTQKNPKEPKENQRYLKKPKGNPNNHDQFEMTSSPSLEKSEL